MARAPTTRRQTPATDVLCVSVVSVCADCTGAVLCGEIRDCCDGAVQGVGTGETAVDRTAASRAVHSAAGSTPTVERIDEVVHVAAAHADDAAARRVEKRVLWDASRASAAGDAGATRRDALPAVASVEVVAVSAGVASAVVEGTEEACSARETVVRVTRTRGAVLAAVSAQAVRLEQVRLHAPVSTSSVDIVT